MALKREIERPSSVSLATQAPKSVIYLSSVTELQLSMALAD